MRVGVIPQGQSRVQPFLKNCRAGIQLAVFFDLLLVHKSGSRNMMARERVEQLAIDFSGLGRSLRTARVDHGRHVIDGDGDSPIWRSGKGLQRENEKEKNPCSEL